jgi:hypothetical protein
MIAPAAGHLTNKDVRQPRCPEAESALLGWTILNGSRARDVLDHIVRIGRCVCIRTEEIDRLVSENTIPSRAGK